MTREELLRTFEDSYEQLIATASEVAQRGAARQGEIWGPREIVAHMAGWEVMASVRIPRLTAGKTSVAIPSFEAEEAEQQNLMNDAINTTIVTMIGEQSLATLCSMLRTIYQNNLKMLRALNDSFFQPGDYVYERTKDVAEHCQEHIEQLAALYF